MELARQLREIGAW